MYKRIIIIVCLGIICSLKLVAQGREEIRAVFDEYGKQQGSVFVHLSHDILSQGSNLSLYKSLVIENIDENVKNKILTDLLANKETWKIMSEMRKNGIIEIGTYSLGKDDTHKLNTFLLLKTKNKRLTILYIEGSFAPERLDQELKKLKDLFVYVNNKKVKLN